MSEKSPFERKKTQGELERERRYQPDPHRLLPQAPDAEKGVLSSFLIAPREIGGFLAENRMTEEHFAIPGHALIFKYLMQMWDMNEPIDFITLTQFLRDLDLLDQSGGAAFVTELFTFLPTAANCPYYVEILQEKYYLRKAIKVCTMYASKGYDDQADVEQFLDEMEEHVLKVRGEQMVSELVTTKEAIITAMERIEDVYSRKGSITGLATGYPDYDRMMDGLHPSEVSVIAGRPSNGKTALAMNMAEFIAIELQRPVGVFSLEMSTQQLIQRMLCSRARVNLSRVRDGFLSERDFPALQHAAAKISSAAIHIDDTGGLTIQELRARARRMKQRFAIEVLFVDYIQLLRSMSKRAQENRAQEVSEASSGLKALAKELQIPIVVLAQIKRSFDERGSGRPRLSDLRESGSIEQDADNVAFIVRSELNEDDPEQREALKGKAELIVAKQRNGPIGDIPLTFLSEYARFETRASGDWEEPAPGSYPV
jgi:replicative DNA helicase